MAQTIQIKQSNIAADVPSTLLVGELAVNTTDRRLFVGSESGVIDLLNGSIAEPANPNIQLHISNNSNPHNTTASQIGAEPANSNIQSHIFTVNANPHGTDHSQLDSIGVLDTTSSDITRDKHVSNNQGKVWQDHINITSANPHGTDHYMLDGLVGNGEIHLGTVEYANVIAIPIIQQDSKDPTGWVNSALITSEYDSVTDTITLTGTLDYYWRGIKKSLTSPWVSPAHSSTIGISYFLYSTDGDTFAWSTTPWDFSDVMIAYVQHGITDLFAINELHGLLQWQAHEMAHQTHGSYRQSGGMLADYTAGSTVAVERRPSVSSVVIHDEDLETFLPALADDGPYTTHYLTSTGTTNFSVAYAEIVPVSGNQPYYNSYSAPNWSQTLMSNNTYMSVWLLAIPVTSDAVSQAYRFVWIQGQSAGSLASQQALTPANLNIGQLKNLAPESVFLSQVIIQYIGGNWNINSVITLTGSGSSYIGAVTGYLSSVATDATLTGDGTVGNPLHVAVTGGAGVTEPFNAVFVAEDTTVVVNVVNTSITATSKIAVHIDGEEAAILEMAGRLLVANTGDADIICHAPNGATGTYSGYISIS